MSRSTSTSVTCILGSSALRLRATVVPPKPPPTTTTRGAACASAGIGSIAVDASAAELRRNSLRVRLLRTAASYFCAASQAAIGFISSSVKPLAIRPMTVDGFSPERNSAISFTVSSALRPVIFGTGVSAAALVA